MLDWDFYVHVREADARDPDSGWLVVPLAEGEPVTVRLTGSLTRVLMAFEQQRQADKTSDRPEPLKGACSRNHLARIYARLAGDEAPVAGVTIKKYIHRIRHRIRKTVWQAQPAAVVPEIIEACAGGTGLLRLTRGLRIKFVAPSGGATQALRGPEGDAQDAAASAGGE